MPTLAAHDSRNPTDRIRNGSHEQQHGGGEGQRPQPCGRADPGSEPTIEHAAIAQARSTDGSHLVIVPKITRTASPAARRPTVVNRRSNGPTRTKTNATFSPDTATR